MTISAKQAAEKCMNLGKQFQAVIDVGECLDQIGNLEVATQEAEAAIETAVGLRAVAEQELADTKSQGRTASAEVKAAKQEAITILTDVNMARDRLLAQARAERDKIVGAATSAANTSIAEAQAKVGVLSKQSAAFSTDIKQLTGDLENLRYEMQVLRDRLGD